MSEMARQFSDREIAEDILTGHKYLANYYYAPAILESQNPELRSVLQQVHSDTQSQARQVFDYLNAKGWYPVKPADNVDLTELKNVAERSRSTVSAITHGTTGGQIPAMSMQQGQGIGYQGQTWQTGTGAAGMNPQAQAGWQPMGGGWQTGAQWQAGNPPGWTGATGWGGAGAGWQTGGFQGAPWQAGRWTGTEAGEGQGGMGPSSVAQWSRWGGQPSWTGFGGTGYAGGGTGFGAGGFQGAFQGAGARGAWQQPDIGQRGGQYWAGGQFGGGFGTAFGTGSGQGVGTGAWYGRPSGSYQVNLPDWARQDRPELGSDRG